MLLLGVATAQMLVQPTVRITAPIDSHKVVTLKKSVPPMVNVGSDAGRMNPAARLGRMVLVLSPTAEQDKAAADMVDAQHDPKSPFFHKWLTPAQFGQLYGVADSDAAQVKNWLESNGLTVHEVAAGRRFVTFSGTVAQVEKTFATQMHSYKYKGKSFVANSQEVKIPAALQSVVQGVARLSSTPQLTSPKIQGPAKFNKSTGQVNLSDGSHAMSPADLAKIYNIQPLWDAGIDGTGQSIAIVGRTDIDLQNIRDFRSFTGIKYPDNVPTVIVNGDDPGDASIGDDVEATLDVTWSGAVAPGAKLYYVTSPSYFNDGIETSAAYIVDHNLAPIVSVSYGSCEYGQGYTNPYIAQTWQQAAAQGMTVFVSSGDNGVFGCVGPGSGALGSFYMPGSDVSALASTPYNVAVGGTQFDDTADPSQYWASTSGPGLLSAKGYIPEIVWNESSNDPINVNLYSSSGGASAYHARPAWQKAPGVDDWEAFFLNNVFFGWNYLDPQGQMPSPFGNPNVPEPRLVPDVSLAAAGHDGYLLCFLYQGVGCQDGYFMTIGGTSASAPAWAGIMALVDQKAGSAQGNPNPVLYSLFTQEHPNHVIFHDIVNGNNFAPGDDMASQAVFPWGLNTPDILNYNPGDKSFGYGATPGYDVTTGLGSVDVKQLVDHWTALGTSVSHVDISPKGFDPTQPITHGTVLTFAVKVTADTGNTTIPTGSVTLVSSKGIPGPGSNTLAIGSGDLDSGGNVTIQTAAVPGGTTQLWARYSGDSNFNSGVSTPIQFNVSKEATAMLFGEDVGGDLLYNSYTTNGTMIPVEQHYGEPIPFLAVVAAQTLLPPWVNPIYPTGTVSLSANGKVIQTNNMQYGEKDWGGSMTGTAQSTSFLVYPGGLPVRSAPYIFEANYSGDESFLPTHGDIIPVLILKADTSVDFTVTGSAIVPNVSTQVAGSVALASGAIQPISGTVTFQDVATNTTIGTANVNPDGSFTGTVKFAATGTDQVQALFSGDANTNPSMRLKRVNVIAKADTTNTLSTSAAQAAAGTAVNLTATVSSGLSVAPTGNVSFADASGTIGTAVLDGTGKAVLTTNSLSGGSHNIIATYSGDANNNSSSSAAVVLNISDFKMQVYAGAGSTPTVTVTSGQSGMANVYVTPLGGFNQAVTFKCVGLPANVTCTFGPSSVTPNGTDPIATTLTVSASGSASLSPLHNRWMSATGITFAGVLLVLPFGGRRRRMVLPLMLITLAIVLGAVGCGGSGSNKSTPSANTASTSTYSVTVSSTTSTVVSHNAPMTIVVTR